MKAGAFPSAQEAAEKLKQLQANGPSQEVFTFKEAYPPPSINESSMIQKTTTERGTFSYRTYGDPPHHLWYWCTAGRNRATAGKK